LLILDPLIALCGGGNVNDNAAMSLVMRALKRLAVKFDCAVLVIHHTRKGGDLSNAEAISGASAIVNLARRAIMAVPMTSDEAKQLGVLPSQRAEYFRTVVSKSNLAPPCPDTPWYRLCHVTLPNPEPPTYMSGDGVQAIERLAVPLLNTSPASDEQKIRRAILDVVERGKVIGSETFPYSPNTTGAKNERALLDDAMSAVANATAARNWHPGDLQVVVERSVEAMKADGWLAEEEIKKGRFRRGRGLRVDWPCTPWPDPTTSSSSPAPDQDGLQQGADKDCGQLVNGVVND
jgi:AAA domain